MLNGSTHWDKIQIIDQKLYIVFLRKNYAIKNPVENSWISANFPQKHIFSGSLIQIELMDKIFIFAPV